MASEVNSVETGLRVTAGLDFLRSGGGEELREHYLWQIKQMMSAMPPDQLSTSALVSLVAVLIPEHARLLAAREPGTVSGTVLRLVRDGGDVRDGAAG